MPISTQLIHDKILSGLDAEGSQRYTFAQDTKFAINAGMDIIITALNQAFAENKLSPESLRELVKVFVWQANQYSRVSYSEADTGHPKWTIFGVYPKIVANRGVSGSPTADPSESKFRADVSFVSSKKSAKRLTPEEWNQNIDNAFMAGNNVLKGTLADYAYLDEADYTSTSYAGAPGKVEITIRPDIPGELVAIAYLKYPNQVSAISDTIELPQSLTEVLVDAALMKIATKQGDGTNLFSVSQAFVQRLISLLK